MILQTQSHPVYVLENVLLEYCTPNQNLDFLDMVPFMTPFHSALTHQQETIFSDGLFTGVFQIKWKMTHFKIEFLKILDWIKLQILRKRFEF